MDENFIMNVSLKLIFHGFSSNNFLNFYFFIIILKMYPLCVLASSQEFPQNAWKCDLKNSSFAKVTVSVRKVYKTNRKEQNSKIETPYLSIGEKIKIKSFG